MHTVHAQDSMFLSVCLRRCSLDPLVLFFVLFFVPQFLDIDFVVMT